MFKLKKSRFAIDMMVEFQGKNWIAVYHTMNEAFVLLPSETLWKNILNNSESGEVSDLVADLVEQDILLEKGINETLIFDLWKQQYVHTYQCLKSKNIVTRKCNNRCLYCIIDPEAKSMSLEIAGKIDEFYLARIEEHSPDKVIDDYIGGEPLLNLKVIMESASRRSYFCKGMGIEYGFTVTSNGILLTSYIVEKLERVGLTSIRVSMAGPSEIHDTLRPAADGGGTYEKIMKNLEEISGKIPITIECQYDAGSDDYLKIPLLLDDLYSRNIKGEKIAFTPILAKRGEEEFRCGMGDPTQMLLLNKFARERGFQVEQEAPSNKCMADFRSFYVFDTDGSIIPCASLQGGEMAYGHVSSGINFLAEAQLMGRKMPERCLNKCELLPMCWGGCRLQALAHDGGFTGIDCHYGIYRHFLEHWMEQKALSVLSECEGPRSEIGK